MSRHSENMHQASCTAQEHALAGSSSEGTPSVTTCTPSDDIGSQWPPSSALISDGPSRAGAAEAAAGLSDGCGSGGAAASPRQRPAEGMAVRARGIIVSALEMISGLTRAVKDCRIAGETGVAAARGLDSKGVGGLRGAKSPRKKPPKAEKPRSKALSLGGQTWTGGSCCGSCWCD